MAKLYVVGLGPGGKDCMTSRAIEAIEKSKVIVGYKFYVDLIKDMLGGKEVITTGMRGEIQRCQLAIEKVKHGLDTSIISTGDAGLYGMAGPILELAEGIDVEVVPGVTSCFAAAAELGAPIMHDFCSISLSDLLTPWEVIEKRLECAGAADFSIALYNPRSHGRPENLKKAIDILLKYKKPDTPVGIVKNAGRNGNQRVITTISNIEYELVDMATVLIIGNSATYVKGDKMITPRGYKI
ncbi:MAG TPA: precorrin-3B C(17)-methyltransferase [Thermoanaerobacterales bacterium]|jgi:precorrin-3B C17-methyltransferase|uniref:precorrin-3B C(17)-methyltransferase n=1 Tax=Tepidanaerobacter sp. GT38 TaxID=2722793 RepID=UPI0018478680|nr:precorrin-3B C(17)-methyltransferase [Tepidanaerobacter sp. GT38]MCG1011661.1 precorrin-3B C(17)-methyltransferase [Tepidanaerobacter sp. GT38]HHY41540.1 precorrin-3B C(17)-methyltransferase [Thermoanaerobacterales bacterium]